MVSPAMPGPSEQRAIDVARERLGLEAATPARVFEVARADADGGDYYLVVLGAPDAAVGVAAVDVATAEVTEWAALPGTRPHTMIDAGTAVQLAGPLAEPRAELVWSSSPASRSPLYPVWRVGTGDDAVYVDQQGGVRPLRELHRRGGG